MPENYSNKQRFRNELEKMGYLTYDEADDIMVVTAPLHDILELADKHFTTD